MTRTVLITGTSSGIGLETVLGIAKSDPECNFILINRNIESTQKSICHLRAKVPDINILKTYEMDLFKIEDVVRVAETVRSDHKTIDSLILNAGIMMPKFKLTTIGIESQMQINFVSNKIFVDILLPLVICSPKGRVICLSSIAHQWSYRNLTWSRINPSRTNYGSGTIAYGDSKLAVILWMRQMARMHKSILFLSVHPGICRTNLFRHCNNSLLRIILSFEEQYPMLTKSPAEGAKSSIYLANAEKSFLTSGGYYADSKLQFLPKPEPEKTKQIFKLADEVFKKSKKNA